MKVVKTLKLEEIFCIEGSYFYVTKYIQKDSMRRTFTKYLLNVFVRKEKIDKVKELGFDISPQITLVSKKKPTSKKEGT